MAARTAMRKSPLSKAPAELISEDAGWNLPRFDPTELRREGARFVKCLIRARWKCDRNFMPEQGLREWHLDNIADDRLSADRLLEEAASALATLNTEFVPRCGSGGIPVGDESDVTYRCATNVVSLVPPEGGGPHHNQALLDAANKLKKGETVDWNKLAHWEGLANIRADLDLLPDPDGKDQRPAHNFFRRRGSDWEIRFAGGQPNTYKHLVGIYYLYELLKSPNRDMFPDQLVALRRQFEQTSLPVVEPVSSSERQAGRRLGVHVDEVADSETIKNCKSRREEIYEEVADARECGDTAKMDAVLAEAQFLAKQIRANGLGGQRHRFVAGKPKNFRDSVRNAIDRAIKEIGEKDQAAAVHFEGSLNTNNGFKYSPENPMNWEFKSSTDELV